MISLNDLTTTENEDGILIKASRCHTLDQIISVLSPYYNYLVTLYENELIEQCNDYRTGYETYGYKDLDAIRGTLSYISDRWKSSFRVRWLIDLINKQYILYDGYFKGETA